MMQKLLTVIAIAIILFLLTMIFVIWGWSLFMVPVFKMAPLTVSQAFGFTLLAYMFGKPSINK